MTLENLKLKLHTLRKKSVLSACFLLLLSPSIIETLNYNNLLLAREPIANLVLKTSGIEGWAPDEALLIAQCLREIGIQVEIKIIEWSTFLGILIYTHDYDLGIVSVAGSSATPDRRSLFTEEGSLNMFGLKKDIPYCNLSEIMQEEGMMIMDLEERQQHYYQWQQLMMDKIIPILPMFTGKFYGAYWSNIKGYDPNWGIINSLPYMYFDGYHEGQESLNEFNDADSFWTDLNPLFAQDTQSFGIISYINEPIIQWGAYNIPIKTGLIYDWEMIDELHYKFYMRDDVYWNPSYNISKRTASSVPLSSIPTGELMVGLKNGEYSDGTNQQVTAKDAVFTYLTYANPGISNSPYSYYWISDCYVDPTDPLAFHIKIDGNPYTPEAEPYADFWINIPLRILPEFYLNSTNPSTTYTYGGVKCVGLYPDMILTPQWKSYSFSPFGCGKFMLDYYTVGAISVLKRSPYWFGVGAIDGQTGLTPFVETINIRVIKDSYSALNEFLAGKLDFISLLGMPNRRKQLQTDPRFVIYSTLLNGYDFMFFNLQRPFIGGADNYEFLTESGKEEYTKALAVRKAICYAIDRETMNDIVFDGLATICHSVIWNSATYYYYNEIIKYDYNLDSAFEWLSAAGYYIDFWTSTETTNPTSIQTETTPFCAVIFVICFTVLLNRNLRDKRKKKIRSS